MNKAVVARPDRPYRPVIVRIINSAGSALGRLGLVRPSLEAETLLKEAQHMTGLSDFGGTDFIHPLGLFCESLERDAKLNTLGRIIARAHIVQLLVNRLEMTRYRSEHPEIDHESIERPLFIIGLPRTGTTIMHSLLDQDPANRSPLSWEMLAPVPPPCPETYSSDQRITKIQKQFDQFYRLSPGFEAVHPMAADMPQECVAIWSHEFMSVQFFMQFNVSSYVDWLDEQDMAHVYRAHKRFLQFLQYGGVRGERWLLKSPAHVNLIDTLLDTYPDAAIIHTHREPVTVIASLTSLASMMRGMSSDYINTREMGVQFLDWYEKLLAQSVQQREKLKDRSHQFFDLKLSEVLRDPIECVERIYDRFKFNISPEVKRRMEQFMKDNPRDKHGNHTYSAEDFGIDITKEQGRFKEYIEWFCT